jgi:hypothetical protein
MGRSPGWQLQVRPSRPLTTGSSIRLPTLMVAGLVILPRLDPANEDPLPTCKPSGWPKPANTGAAPVRGR